jgi:50S ribosomal protein L16 3-hydroxylase
MSKEQCGDVEANQWAKATCSGDVSGDLNLGMLLGNCSIQKFVTDDYHRLPYSAGGLAKSFCELGTWESLAAVLNQDDADVLVCRRNEQYSGAMPRNEEQAKRLVDDGFTLLVRHAEKHDERLAKVAAQFARDFAAPVNIHMYCTPGGHYGFGWHYDAEEVFIIQTTGRKQYSLRKNTVNPWPIEETLPSDMQYEREIMPLMRCELSAGDWLYIPSGYWHMGESRETAISLAIGVQQHTAVEVFDFLRPHILESLLWRQRLPVLGSAAVASDDDLRQQIALLMAQLGQDIQKLLTNPRQIDALIAHLRGLYTS